MKVIEASKITRGIDYVLGPCMWVLNGFKFPLQETHKWHTYNIDPKKLGGVKGQLIKNPDRAAKFSHDSHYGLFHMPIFGGLTKYAVLEVNNYKGHWHVAWKGEGEVQIHRLPIFNSRIKLLTGTDEYRVFALGDNGKILPIKLIGYGKIGDGKYKGARLF